MPNLFTTESKLIDICFEGGTWYNIVQKLSEVLVCNDSKTEEWDKTNPFLLSLHRSQTSIYVDNEFLEDIQENKKNVRELYNPIYILDFPEEDAKKISEKYGVIFLPSKNTPEPSIAKTGWSIDTSDKSKPNSWDFILKELGVPLHSILIIDRYLFSDEVGETIEDSLYNLRDILSTLLKQTNVEDLTVSIVFDHNKTEYTFNELANKVNKIKRSLYFPKPFNIELISVNSNCYKYDETHDRFIISDYFIVDAQHKIKAFSSKGSHKNLCNQLISFEYLYGKGIGADNRSSIPAVSQERVLNALTESIQTSKGEMMYAINGQIKRLSDTQPVNELLLKDFDS